MCLFVVAKKETKKWEQKTPKRDDCLRLSVFFVKIFSRQHFFLVTNQKFWVKKRDVFSLIYLSCKEKKPPHYILTHAYKQRHASSYKRERESVCVLRSISWSSSFLLLWPPCLKWKGASKASLSFVRFSPYSCRWISFQELMPRYTRTKIRTSFQ